MPDLNWNPLDDPDSNARYGEHYVDQSDGPGSAAPSTTDGSGGSAALAPRTGTFKVTLVTVQLSGKTVADTNAINLTAARNSIINANNYWNSSSAGRLSFTKVNEYRHQSAAKITDSYGVIMDKVTRELGWQYRPYEALVIFVPHADLSYNGSWGILGGGFTDGPTSGRVIMPYPSALTNNVVAHEFGHVLGLHHANSLACSNGRSDVSRSGGTWTDRECYSAEYSDTTDLMGYAQVSSPRVNAFMWEYGGFGNGQEIRNLGTPTAATRVSLKPWAGTATARAAKFTDPVSKEVYYLEARLAVGYDSQTAVGGNEGVKITKRDNLGWSGNASIVLTPDSRRSGWGNTSLTWQQGQTFTTFAGTKVRIDSLTSAGATVTVTPKVIAPVAPALDRTELRFSGPDFTGDGITDLFHRRADGTLWVSPGTTGNTYGTPRKIGTGWSSFNQVFAVGDFNGDRHADLAARKTNGELWLYPGNGSGGFLKSSRIGTGWQSFDTVLGVGDVTGDGRADIAARNAGTLSIYPGSGTSGFKARITSGTSWQGLKFASGIGDYSGDDAPDLIARDTAGKLVMFRSLRNGQFAPAKIVGSGWGGFTDVMVGQDVNRDGRADTVARSSDGRLTAYLGNGFGGYLKETIAAGQWNFTETIDGTDFDSNGTADLLTINSAGALALHSGTGAASTTAPRQIGRGWQNFTEVMNGRDFDGNGKPDLIARTKTGNLVLYTTDGTARFTGQRTIGTGWNGFTDIISPGDFNGDSRPDLIARTKDGTLFLYPGTGTGTFKKATKIGTGWNTFTTIAPAHDINGDKKADLLAITPQGTAYIYPGNGTGGWKPRIKTTEYWSATTIPAATRNFAMPNQTATLTPGRNGSLTLRNLKPTGELNTITLNTGKL
ncbi:FG-GAP-like repeat-containing protein [uncultured Arthrobacter sp.]|uniref:FG-GAP-like repeat-containing protein n=1 Tax=uncultured Arthrobacter sp. TaxID=114050 RepID=UPI002634272A|nr:FG-GAP-like repeat-containing protein [uncultured Arthrobacter sp.]